VSPAPATLMVGLALAGPSLWASLVEQTLPTDVAIERLVIILLVVSVVASALRGLVHAYAKTSHAPHKAADSRPDRRKPV
jgi:hypothetical protein